MSDGEQTSEPDRSTVRAALRLAGRAPSVHNTQPWRWIARGAELRLLRDTERLLEVADPAGRQLVISCGAVLDHARTAFAAAGWECETTRFPDHNDPDLLAVLTLRPWSDPPPQILARAEAITARRTDRLPMAEPPHWQDLLSRLHTLPGEQEVHVDVVEESARPRLAAASEHTAAMQRYDMQYQSELRWWTGHSRPDEGIPPRALPTETDAARNPVGRPFPTAEHAPGPDLEDRSRVAVLSTVADSPLDWLRAGEVLSALLLECTAAGAATCALTHLTELPAARRVVAGLIPDQRTPQILIRIGTALPAPHQPPTPRRPVEDYLI
ncbi:Acg family FMN-binding oxidoreductase [Nocardia takedensis]